MADVIKSDLRGTRKDRFGIAGVDLEVDGDTLSIPDTHFFGDGKGSLGAMYAIGVVTTDFEFDFATNGTRQSVALSADAGYHITCVNLAGNGLHQMCLHNTSSATLTPTWGERFDFGAAGPPVIPPGTICVINALWDAVGVALHCVHNCPAPTPREGAISASFGPPAGELGVVLPSRVIYIDLPADYVLTGWQVRCYPAATISVDARYKDFPDRPSVGDSITDGHAMTITADTSNSGAVADWSETSIARGGIFALALTANDVATSVTATLFGVRA